MNYEHILLGKYEPIESPDYSDEVKQFIYSMLVVDPDQRPSFKDLFESPMMKNYAEQRANMDPNQPKLFRALGHEIKAEEEKKKKDLQ